MKIETPGQLEAAKQIRLEVFVGEQNVPVEEEIDWRDSSAETVHVLLTDEAGPTATARAYCEDGIIHVGRVAVVSRVRGTGVGRVVMAEIEKVAREAFGNQPIELSAQVQAIGFYEAIGYELVAGETYLDAGIPHRDMRKDPI